MHNIRAQETCFYLLLVVFKPSDKRSRACAAQLLPSSYCQNFNFAGPGDRSVAQHVLLFQVDFQVQRTTYLKCWFENIMIFIFFLS